MAKNKLAAKLAVKPAKLAAKIKPLKSKEKSSHNPPIKVSGAKTPTPDPQLRELAISHRNKYLRLHNALANAQSNMRAFGKEVKEDGLSMRQIKLMVELSTPEGEAAWRMTIAADLMAAQYQGAGIGQQLVLFMEPDRTPATEIAYDEGQKASMSGESPKPPYHPSTPQYTQWITGYQDHQSQRLKEGIKPLATGFVPMSAEEMATQQAEAEKAGAIVPRTREMAAKRAAVVTDKPAGNA